MMGVTMIGSLRVVGMAALLCVGVAIASPALCQLSPSPYTSGTRYDAMGRVVGTISADPDSVGSGNPYLATRITYNAGGLPTKTEKGTLTAWQSQDMDPVGWTGFTVNSSTEISYDSYGRKTMELLRGSDSVAYSLTQYSYDSLSRLQCTAVRMNPATYGSLPVDACTLSTQGSNGPDRVTENTYDAAGQLTKVQKAFGTSVQADYAIYAYTANGKQQYVTDANGNKAQFTYDYFDRQIAWAFPSKTTAGQIAACTIGTVTEDASGIAGPSSTRGSNDDCEKYWYDHNGNRAKLQKRDGSTIAYGYDALNRVTSKIIPSRADLTGAQTRSVFYDYDLRGLQLYARFDNGAATSDGVTSKYDGFGEIVLTTLKLGTFSKALAYDYDDDGNRKDIVHPEGTSVYTFTYAYDGIDRLNALCTGTAACTSTSSTLADAFTYAGNGLLSNRREGSTAASSVAYSWDNIGRLRGQTDDFSGSTGDVSWTLSYSPASQLTTETRDNSSYAFGAFTAQNSGYAVNGLDQYTSTGNGANVPTYDGNGNLKFDGTTWTYTYDIENRLVKAVSGSTTVNLAYDPLGRLFQTDKGSSGTTTKFLYDGDALVLEYNSSNAVLDRYVHGSNAGADDPLIWYDGSNLNTVRWLHADHLGSIVGIAGPSGTNVYVNSYDEYGTPNYNPSTMAVLNTGRFQYTGQAFIPELNLYYYKARFYSPNFGRFLQTDPVGYSGGINLYGYVGDDPLNMADPTGEAGCPTGGSPPCPAPPPPPQDQPKALSFVAPAATAVTGAAEGLSATAVAPALPALLLSGDTPSESVYITYTKTNSETGEVYSGRASTRVPLGTPLSPRLGQQILNCRECGHHMNLRGFGPATLDRITKSYSAVRGREQQLINHFGGARSMGGTSGNAINGISIYNPARVPFLGSSTSEFGALTNNSNYPEGWIP